MAPDRLPTRRPCDIIYQIKVSPRQGNGGNSHARRSDAQSRMSTGFSEAVRGVNTCATPEGFTLELSAGAEHVYQNKYGDAFGVSGPAADGDILSKLDWTELNRK